MFPSFLFPPYSSRSAFSDETFCSRCSFPPVVGVVFLAMFIFYRIKEATE